MEYVDYPNYISLEYWGYLVRGSFPLPLPLHFHHILFCSRPHSIGIYLLFFFAFSALGDAYSFTLFIHGPFFKILLPSLADFCLQGLFIPSCLFFFLFFFALLLPFSLSPRNFVCLFLLSCFFSFDRFYDGWLVWGRL